ncbi:MAG: cupredoxin domain-containing protein [Candidatus Aenigmarchaeota archaeon]|nr:cupredoxin domain-containing protein [Candidatus Aenigmarchaeota archaeon]
MEEENKEEATENAEIEKEIGKDDMELEKEETVKIRKSHLLSVLGAVVIVSFFILAAQAVIADTPQSNSRTVTGQVVVGSAAPVQDGKQIVKLTVQGSTYYPNPMVLKKGVPVEVQVDMTSVRGCFRGIQIPAFGVRKLVTDSDNKITFTPDKAGTFGFSCFMGMGRGQIVVQDESGQVPADVNTVAQDIQSGSSCGGGCGCGGG